MKCLLAQINTTVGDIDGNLRRSLDALAIARERGADLLVLPEQTIPGYPTKDLLTQASFIARNQDALARFAPETASGPAALIGYAEPHGGPGKGLYNSVALCRGGVVEQVYRKMLLPTYDVFDEARYFDSGSDVSLFDIGGMTAAITVCEDMWNDELYWSRRLYTRDPIADSARAGGRLILNLSASPYTIPKRRIRAAMIASAARRHGAAILQVNSVGGNDDLIFDGGSVAFDGTGTMRAQAASFIEDFVEVTVSSAGDASPLVLAGRIVPEEAELEELRRALVLGIRDYVGKCGFTQVLIGLSGGIDSALVAVLAAEALGPANVHGVSMPSRYSSDHSKDDARQLAEALGISYRTIPIEAMFSTALAVLTPHLGDPSRGAAAENMQSRLRGLTLMALSNSSGAMVLTTGNKSEMSVGYCTLYGDMCGGLAAIADVPKTIVYTLSRHINDTAGREVIPYNTIEKPPSAELAPGQKDTDSLPPYDVLDPIVRGHVEEGQDEERLIALGHDAATVRRVLRMIRLNEYKRRQAPPTLKVTSRAFGYGWRMPLARK